MHIYLGLSTNVGEFLRVKIFRIVKILCPDKERRRVFVIFSLFFTAFAAVVMFQKWKEDRRVETNMRPNFEKHNSGVRGAHPGKELVINTEDSDSEGGEHNAALLSWKDLSCKNPSRKSGSADVTTMSGVSGEIRYKELVAIMVSDNCNVIEVILSRLLNRDISYSLPIPTKRWGKIYFNGYLVWPKDVGKT